MSRLRNLYTYLITNDPSGVDGWYEDYKTLTCEVAAVRSALKDGHHLKEPETYAKTKSFNNEGGWKEFTDQLLRSKKNGVSGTGPAPEAARGKAGSVPPIFPASHFTRGYWGLDLGQAPICVMERWATTQN